MSEMSPGEVRERLDHPVVDSDGHYWEHWPDLDRYVRDEGISEGLNALWATGTFDGSPHWAGVAPEERPRVRPLPTDVVGCPVRQHRRPGCGHGPRADVPPVGRAGLRPGPLLPDVGAGSAQPAQRRDPPGDVPRPGTATPPTCTTALATAWCRWATIPTATPQEAVDALDHAVIDLGFKVAMLGGFAVRDLEGGGTWIDSLGLDSVYDYDPLWQRLVELGVVAGFHSGSMGWSGRRSITNFSYNHMGNFAGASEATLKSLLFGGVLHRFPGLRLAFLEGGTHLGGAVGA